MSDAMTAGGAGDELAEIDTAPAEVEVDESKSAPADRESTGPFDITEVPAMRPYVDFGGVKVAPREGLQLRLDVEEASKRVVAISLDLAGSTLQVQAFSAPRSTGLWHGIRAQSTEQLTGQGAAVEEREGAFGPELWVTRAVAEPAGATQLVRLLGVDGPRWMLRGVVTGQATSDDEAAAQIDEVFRDLVVVRGDQPMPPRELLALRVPAGSAQA